MLKEMLLEEAKQITVDVALDDLFESEPAAFGASAPGRIEREEARLDLLDGHAAVGAGIVGGIQRLLLARIDDDDAARQPHGVFQAVRQTLLDALFDDEPVDDDVVKVEKKGSQRRGNAHAEGRAYAARRRHSAPEAEGDDGILPHSEYNEGEVEAGDEVRYAGRDARAEDLAAARHQDEHKKRVERDVYQPAEGYAEARLF